ncbi:MAG: efflux RND transporter periplasmic adaptor subunit [Desulfobacterales bacterium]|nr:efflux RND transporter periplasmic adaptor subunit [Desulfobacterales bacterium]
MITHVESARKTPFRSIGDNTSGSLALLVVLLVFPLFLFSACGKKEEPPAKEVVRPVKMLTVAAGQGSLKRSFPGNVEASRKVDLAFKVSGPLIELPVKEGQEVQKGDLIARIDPRDFETELQKINSAIGEARARLKAMRAGARPEDVKVLEAEVKAAKARALNAEKQYKRYKDLFVRKQVSKADFDRYKSERDVAAAQLNTARQNLDTGKKGARKEDIEAMKSNIAGLAAQQKGVRDALADTRLKAPFFGYIASKFVDNFQEVRAKQPIVSLQDISSIDVVIQVPESIMTNVQRDSEVVATAEFAAAPGKQHPLRVKEFATAADPKTQTYKVTFLMRQPEDISVLPGMTASVLVTRSAEDDSDGGIVIPAIALFSDDAGAPHVWVFNPDAQTVDRRKVTTGDLTGSESIRITSGLDAGETIAIAGVSRLRQGMKVRPMGEGR